MTRKREIIDINLSASEEEIENEGEVENQQQKKRRYQRHTAEQIKRLEEFFIDCPHPDKRMRAELGDEIGLESTQVKFWFQNKRMQIKAKQENEEKMKLRAENDILFKEKMKYKEALKSGRCYFCGCLTAARELTFDDRQSLLMENARLKKEFDRVSAITTKLFGKPITNFTPSGNGKGSLSE